MEMTKAMLLFERKLFVQIKPTLGDRDQLLTTLIQKLKSIFTFEN
jgi:hypothetical protein